MTVDEQIREKLNIQNLNDVTIYQNPSYRDECLQVVKDIVNSNIEPVASCHNPSLETELKENGYIILENFYSDEEVDDLINLTKDVPGYNYHVAATCFNREPQVFSEDCKWNILSYEPSVFFQSNNLLNRMCDPELFSLSQAYLGCFPTLYSVNGVWSKFTGEEFKTQLIHRDYDDYKFLSLFIFLTDIDETNGPHIFYPKTQDGSEPVVEPVSISGKRGTAVLADTFALHHGKPLEQGQRFLLWCRYGTHINNIHYKSKFDLFKQDEKEIFSKVEDSKYTRYFYRAFTK